ncbi:hypothetical protein DH2020_018025 [Rehmannia glutinosa]|uniref:Exostosin GT47 domain-containing protein n=1 Tax=Rehmannia glutinosa TaxID=99300 RepID=A0ABR0WHP6_REHGL
MEGCKKRLCSWWKTSSSSTRLLGFMVPLMVVSGLVVLLGSNSSNWVFASNYYYPWAWSSVFPGAPVSGYGTNFSGFNDFAPPVDEGGSGLELRRRVVGGGDTEEAALAVDYNLRRSTAPPVAVEVREAEPPVEDKKEDFIITTNRSDISPPSNDTNVVPVSPRINRSFTKLQILEAKMQQARAAIRDAQRGNNGTYDSGYIPTGPIYWNPSAFHRSYLEMEKQFKLQNIPIGIGALDQIISCFLAMIGYVITISLAVGCSMLVVYFFTPEGPELSKSLPELFKNSIRALCNANTSEGFQPSKDVSIPEINLPGGRTNGLIGGPSPSRRPILVFFAGRLHGPIRPILLEHWENKDPDVQVHRYLPKNVSYSATMRKSRYCICPSGYEVASPRMVEALYTGCVPVLIKDHYIPPFSDVLNWKSFSVEIQVKDIPNLKNILTGISTRQYIRMQRRGVTVRRHFEVNLRPKRYDVFHMTLHSIWLRRLNIRLHGVEDS